MNIEWSTNNGYTLVGSCQADGVCKEKQVLLTGDENTVGTECCFNQYCNHPSKYSFYSSSSSSIRFTFTLTVIALASIFWFFSQNNCHIFLLGVLKIKKINWHDFAIIIAKY